ncbi:MAG: hypothetical protein VX475_07330 [Myxococcota bacterium]|nr:hypothetical protein [Myxococcota bacterium]
MAILTALFLGLLIGAQHAFEPDHLAAVGTIVSRDSHPKSAAIKGAWWGLGHGAAIALIGLPLILMGLELPASLESMGEFLVAIMLVGLGVRAIWRAYRWTTSREQEPKHRKVDSTLPVGLVHGMAGSGAAVVLATTQAPGEYIALLFLVIFVLGSTLGMTLTAMLLTLPLSWFKERTEHALRFVTGVSGIISLCVGFVWGAPTVLGWFTVAS